MMPEVKAFSSDIKKYINSEDLEKHTNLRKRYFFFSVSFFFFLEILGKT